MTTSSPIIFGFGTASDLAPGLLEHRTHTIERGDGTEKTVTQVRVTAKGLTRLARDLGGHRAGTLQ